MALLLALAVGCSSSSSGNRITFFPQRNALTETAKALRQTAAPLPLPRECDKKPLPLYVVEPGDGLLVLTPEPDQAEEARAADRTRPADGKAPPEHDTGLEVLQKPEQLPPPRDWTARATTTTVQVTVHIPADQPVLPDGTINLGPYGLVCVAGKTIDEIEVLVRATVAAHLHRDPGFITVRLVTRDSKVYYVLGEVNNPGAFQLKGRETALDAILAAGGLNDRASRENIILSRPTPPDSCRLVLPVCYNEIVQLGDTTTNYQIAPGDRIFVPSRDHKENSCFHKPGCPICQRPQVPCLIEPVPHDPHEPAPHEVPVPPGLPVPGPLPNGPPAQGASPPLPLR
jgi:protein involved in polysaccharide export with SLBB domain